MKESPDKPVEEDIEPTGRRNPGLAKEVVKHLTSMGEKIVLAESCTGGMVSACMASVPGVSNYFCGSFVTYRPRSKRKWLDVAKKTIDRCTTESDEVAGEMAVGALEKTPEAQWSAAVVGHLGPDSPEEKDGMIHLCIARRTKKGKIKAKYIGQHILGDGTRTQRQRCATEIVLTVLARLFIEQDNRNQLKVKQEKRTKGARKSA